MPLSKYYFSRPESFSDIMAIRMAVMGKFSKQPRPVILRPPIGGIYT